jgi:predicted amidophosphoribosyltransferase
LRLDRRARDSVGLDAAQRAANLAGRITVRTGCSPPASARVLIVDDIITTGATLRGCRSALAGAGARAAGALVLCDATGQT